MQIVFSAMIGCNSSGQVREREREKEITTIAKTLAADGVCVCVISLVERWKQSFASSFVSNLTARATGNKFQVPNFARIKRLSKIFEMKEKSPKLLQKIGFAAR